MKGSSYLWSHARQVCVLVACVALLIPTALGQGGPAVTPNGVVNAAGFQPSDFPGGRLAPGAIISIFGTGLGPPEGVLAESFPLPTELGPLRTQVRLNDTEQCRMVFCSDTQINCELPPDLVRDQDRDRIRLRVITDEGESAEIEAPFGPYGFGLFTRNSNGRGPLAAQNWQDDADPAQRFRMNRPDDAAEPGQVMVLWGTGLGMTDPPVQAGEPAQGLNPAVNQPEVWVGPVRAQVQYAGRAPGFAGLDQIQIVVPDDAPLGCNVGVRLQSRDQDRLNVSNIGTVAIVRNRNENRVCLDPLETVISGLSHGSILLSSGLGRLGPGQLGPGAGLGGPFPRGQGMGGGMGPGQGMGQGMGGGVQGGPGGVGPNGIGPLGLHPGLHLHPGGLDLGPEAVTARFVRLGEGVTPDLGIPPVAADSCNTYFMGPGAEADLFFGPAALLDAGDLTVTGPATSLTLSPITAANGVFYGASLPSPLEEGVYTVSGAGGADVGPIPATDLAVPALLDVTTALAPGVTVSKAASLTLDWTGGNPTDVVLIHGRVFHIPADVPRPIDDTMQFRSQAFLCSTTTAGAGAFTIPEYVWATVPDGMLSINVTHVPAEDGIARFEATGLDLGGVFRFANTTAYLDLVLGP